MINCSNTRTPCMMMGPIRFLPGPGYQRKKKNSNRTPEISSSSSSKAMALRCLAWLGSTQLVSERQRSHNKNRNIWHTGTHTRAHTRTYDPEVELTTPPPPEPTLFFSNNVEQQTVQRLVWFSVGIINWAQTALLSGCTRERAHWVSQSNTQREHRAYTRERASL